MRVIALLGGLPFWHQLRYAQCLGIHVYVTAAFGDCGAVRRAVGRNGNQYLNASCQALALAFLGVAEVLSYKLPHGNVASGVVGVAHSRCFRLFFSLLAIPLCHVLHLLGCASAHWLCRCFGRLGFAFATLNLLHLFSSLHLQGLLWSLICVAALLEVDFFYFHFCAGCVHRCGVHPCRGSGAPQNGSRNKR